MDTATRGDEPAAGGAHVWVIVLAGGQGTRLQALTSDARGVPVPKQFCSLRGGCSLLRAALRRAAAIAPRERICTVVAGEHVRWWSRELADLPEHNVIVQPANRGTANGILLPLLQIARRDPAATVVVLPSDHYADDEASLALALCTAAHLAERDPRHLVLLGIRPEEADPELGYVVPGRYDGHGACTVRRFVEKPPAALAAELLRTGALWNSFILAARVDALLGLFERRIPSIVAGMRAAIERYPPPDAMARSLAGFYAKLPEVDFSREIMHGAEPCLRVLAAPACGWSDLGTPRRVAAVLRRRPLAAECGPQDVPCAAAVNLAAQPALRAAVPP